jgi:GTP cyclohydrolase II
MKGVERYADAMVPTEYGELRTVVYREVAAGPQLSTDPDQAPSDPPKEHVAIVVGDPAASPLVPSDPNQPPPSILVRVHSECWTGEVLRSRKCDCLAQLDAALRAMVERGRGVLVYLRQEGRGIGLGNKIRAYALQAKGADTVDANRMLGFEDDARTYDVAAAILRDLGVGEIELLTNNKAKVEGLERAGVRVARRVPLAVGIHEDNEGYLAVKAKRMGHELP